MSVDAAIRRYLDAVNAHLRIDTDERRRVLEEIDGHLRDATEGFVSEGAAPDAAVKRAIAEFGTADAVADEFMSMHPATRASARPGWLHWLPIALPALLSAVSVVLVVTLLAMLIPDRTVGESAALRWQLQWLAINVALTIGGWFWLRTERPRRRLSPAWSATVVALLLLVR